jgi:hypothetical protein
VRGAVQEDHVRVEAEVQRGALHDGDRARLRAERAAGRCTLWHDPGKPVPYTGKRLPYTGKLWNDPGKPVPYTGKPLPYTGKPWNDPGKLVPYTGKPVPYTGKPVPYTGKLWNDPGKPVPYTGKLWNDPDKPVPYTGKLVPYTGKPWNDPGKPVPYTGKLWNDPGKLVPYTGKPWNDPGKPPTTSPWRCTRRCDRPFMHEGEGATALSCFLTGGASNLSGGSDRTHTQTSREQVKPCAPRHTTARPYAGLLAHKPEVRRARGRAGRRAPCCASARPARALRVALSPASSTSGRR